VGVGRIAFMEMLGIDMKYKYIIKWGSPRHYVLRKWLFDFKHYKVMTFLRVFGLMVQRCREDALIKPPVMKG
jgi:hypothetical protein